MRLKFPSYVSVPKTVAFAGAVVAVQQFQHTSLAFSLLFFTFTVLSAVTFNTSGGMNRPSGSYVLFFSLLTVIAAVVLKAILGEAADSHLEQPLGTMTVYTCGMAMMLVAVVLKNRVVGSARGFGMAMQAGRLNLTLSAAGCILLGTLLVLVNFFVGSTSGSVLSALNQVNSLLPLGMILATLDVVQRSDGKRSINGLVLFAGSLVFLQGVTAFSKQSLFIPPVAWLIGSIYGRLRLRWFHFVSIALLAVGFYTIIVPVAQTGKSLAPDLDTGQRIGLFSSLLFNFTATRAQYQATLDNQRDMLQLGYSRPGYYDRPLGFGDRVAMFQVDDGLISWTDQNHSIGYAPVAQYFENWIPHVLDPHKGEGEPIRFGGNYYAHLIGGYLAPADFTTGISFGFLGECYAVKGWEGVFFLAPLLWMLLFVSVDLIAGDLRTSPWGLLPMLFFLHVAPESLVAGLVYYIWYSNIATVLAIWFCVVVAPLLGSVFGSILPARRGGEGHRWQALPTAPRAT